MKLYRLPVVKLIVMAIFQLDPHFCSLSFHFSPSNSICKTRCQVVLIKGYLRRYDTLKKVSPQDQNVHKNMLIDSAVAMVTSWCILLFGF